MTKNDPTRILYRHARDIDRLLGYLKRETAQYVAESQQNSTDWGHAGSLGHLREQLITAAAFIANKDTESIDDLIASDAPSANQVRTPKKMPPGYSRKHMRDDLMELHRYIDARVTDGYSYLVERDYEMAGTVFTDAADLWDISSLVQEGEFGRAGMRSSGLDTAVRDEIPSRLYNFLYRP